MDLTALASQTVRRLPVTCGLVALCGVVSLLAAPFGGPDTFGYGLPSALSGQWWTFAVGAFVTPTLALVPLLLALLGTVVGILETRLGSRRTAGVLVLTHLAGTLGAAGLLLVGGLLPWTWPWAHSLAGLSDVGPSAAALGALAVLSGTLRPPVRRLLVTGVGGYLVVMVVCSGLLWDLEHLIAFGTGLLLVSTGRARSHASTHATPTSALARVRVGAALLVVMTAVAGLVQTWFPGYGGALGAGNQSDAGSRVAATLVLLGALVLGDGLRRGSRWAWLVAPAGAALALLAQLAGVGWSAGTVACLAAVLALGLVHRRVASGARASAVDVRLPLLRHGGGNLGWQHTWTGSETWSDGEVTIGFRRSAGVAIVLADPIGPRFRWYAATRAFVQHCREQGLVVAWYAVSDAFLSETGREDRALQVGEDAVVELAGLELTGKAWQDVRTARNRATREGITMRRPDGMEPAVLAQVATISAAWADDKPLPEMGFTLGGVREALDPAVRLYVAVDGAGTVHGMVSWLPVHRDGLVVGWTLDLMRRRTPGFRPVMEFLIAESLLLFRDEGFATASLSVAPLARSGPPSGAVEHLLVRFGTLLEPAYGFESLLAFKRKFSPRLSPVHLAYESCLDLPRIAVALGHAYVPTVSPAQARHVVRTLVAGRTGVSRERASRPPAAPTPRPAPRQAAAPGRPTGACPTATPRPTPTRQPLQGSPPRAA
jgi:phosphatidylglycerol lysyltransferase